MRGQTCFWVNKATRQTLFDDALDRAKAYAATGASGFFIPGLRDDALIGRICDGVALPVNVMVDLPPEKWTPGYADFASARSGVM